MNLLSVNQILTPQMAFLNLSSDLSSLNDLTRLIHSFEANLSKYKDPSFYLKKPFVHHP